MGEGFDDDNDDDRGEDEDDDNGNCGVSSRMMSMTITNNDAVENEEEWKKLSWRTAYDVEM